MTIRPPVPVVLRSDNYCIPPAKINNLCCRTTVLDYKCLLHIFPLRPSGVGLDDPSQEAAYGEVSSAILWSLYRVQWVGRSLRYGIEQV